jgi:hypothetical protein
MTTLFYPLLMLIPLYFIILWKSRHRSLESLYYMPFIYTSLLAQLTLSRLMSWNESNAIELINTGHTLTKKRSRVPILNELVDFHYQAQLSYLHTKQIVKHKTTCSIQTRSISPSHRMLLSAFQGRIF